MGRFNGKVAVVTGGNSGIGLASAKRLASEGARVAIFGRNQDTLDAAVEEVGEGAIGIQGDVTSMADLDKLVSTVSSELGQVDDVGRRRIDSRRLFPGRLRRVILGPLLPGDPGQHQEQCPN